jgi:hypothetical protein
LQIVSEEKPQFRWKKQGSQFNREGVPAWNLTLELIAANNRRRGWLALYRVYSAGDLQLDVNLLTSLLPGALADALERVLTETVAITLMASEQTDKTAVRAS